MLGGMLCEVGLLSTFLVRVRSNFFRHRSYLPIIISSPYLFSQNASAERPGVL